MSEALITESEPLTFTLPDGSLKLVRKGTTLQNVAESIDSSVAKNAVYAEIDGQYIDLIEAVQKSGTLNIITLFDEEALDPCTLEQLEGSVKVSFIWCLIFISSLDLKRSKSSYPPVLKNAWEVTPTGIGWKTRFQPLWKLRDYQFYGNAERYATHDNPSGAA